LFISEVKRNNKIKKAPTTPINFKKIKKKIKKTTVKIKMQVVKKKINL